jgi:hypothetical protein
LGIHIKLRHYHASNIYIAALSHPVSSPLQAEAYGLMLAVKAAEGLQLHDAFFLTDSQVLASATRSDKNATEGPWQIKATVSLF